MVGVIVVTHGQFGKYLLEAAQTILGPQEQCAHIAVEGAVEMSALLSDLKHTVKQLETGDGVIILTDMFGGTPSNLAISVMEETHAEVIAGLNLPMLIKLASVRGRETLEACVAHAQDAGRKYISVASWVLTGEK